MKRPVLEPKPTVKIEISHSSALIGHDITVAVTAEGGERIAHVKTDFNGRTIGNDPLSPPNSWYKREFLQQGGITPGVTHKVVVEATSTTGKETASLIWTDVG
jgi:hypothetical protein